MRFGSVCSGIEAASVAWAPLGWKAAWLAEIEPFPCAVLAHHYPSVPNLGDMTTIAQRVLTGEVSAPDVFCGGTPCQAFSVAGLRQSLDDARGNLTLKFVEIADAIDHVRAGRGEDECIVFWENVPGVLSTKDNAFGCFLAGLAGEDGPLEPPGGKWANAGCVFGPQRTVAWRVLDAQYFGVAQRRRRVFVVASARDGFDPAAVLLEFEGLRRDSPPRREARQDAAADAAPGAGDRRSHWDGVEHPHPTLNQSFNTGAIGYSNQELFSQRGAGLVGEASTGEISHCLNAGGMGRQDYETETLVTHALRAEGFDASEDGTGRGTPLVPVQAFYSTESRCDNFPPPDVSPPLKVGSNGGGQPPAIAFSAKDHGSDATEELAPTLRAMPHDASHANGGGQMAVAFPLQEVGKRTGISTDDPRAGIGIGQDGDPMFTLQAGAQHGVAYPLDLRNASRDPDKRDEQNRQGLGLGEDGDPSPTISTAFVPGVAAYAFQPRIARNGRGGMGDVVNALNAQSGGTGKGDAAPCVAVADTLGVGSNQTSGFESEVVAASMAVRRLTPEECETLQG
ncbi:MAG TPA: DNA cytosine methyltransferase, partial [Rhodocyclaceae bacterium]|nr:DNA cytosine methyltransferase [Rhodocyclaceae bacterium]